MSTFPLLPFFPLYIFRYVGFLELLSCILHSRAGVKNQYTMLSSILFSPHLSSLWGTARGDYEPFTHGIIIKRDYATEA